MSRHALRLPTREVLANRYELTTIIGRGQSAEVWSAYDRQLERVVAIKQARADVPGETVTSERLRREAIALAAIESPHVAEVYDVGLGDNGVYVVMRRFTGRTLADELTRQGPVTPARACRIAGDILAGLAAIHATGLCHRDLKPSNVLIDRDDRAVLLDLGAALHPRVRPAVAEDDGPIDVAPDELDAGASDPRGDLLQLGLLLIFLVTGELPRAAIDASQLAVPAALRAVIARALAPLPMRFPSTLLMAQALDQALAVCMLEPFEPPAKPTRRWPEPAEP
jgi:serine/threonine-protein kinase